MRKIFVHFFLITPLCFAVPSYADTSLIPDNENWEKLTAAQQQVLTPLKSEWNQYSPERQKKWLIIANKFQQLNPAQQQRLQDKLQAWASISPEHRSLARKYYIRSNRVESEQRTQKWNQYQQLSNVEKNQLALHPAKNLVTNLPTPTQSKTKKLSPAKISPSVSKSMWVTKPNPH